MKSNTDYTIKVLDKAFKILGLFSEKKASFSIKEICKLLGFNKSSTFRIVKNLEDAAFLTKDSNTGKYKLGFSIYHLGTMADSYTQIHKLARPFLKKLSDQCIETVHFAVLDQGKVLYIDKITGNRALAVTSKIGTKLPCHCTGVGKLLISDISEDELKEIIEEWGLPKLTPNTITSLSALKKELETIRKRGYSIDNEEAEMGLKCIAAPLINSKGRMFAAISISAPKERFNSEKSNFKTIVMNTAKAISDNLIKSGLENGQY